MSDTGSVYEMIRDFARNMARFNLEGPQVIELPDNAFVRLMADAHPYLKPLTWDKRRLTNSVIIELDYGPCIVRRIEPGHAMKVYRKANKR